MNTRTRSDSPPLAYSVDDAARVAGIGRTRLYDFIAAGALPAKKFGKRTIVLADALKAFLDGLPAAQLGAGVAEEGQ
jgi:excisionase family DNA binding protein